MDRNELRMQLENNSVIANYIVNALRVFEEILKNKPQADISVVTKIDAIAHKAYMDVFDVIEQDFIPKVNELDVDAISKEVTGESVEDKKE